MTRYTPYIKCVTAGAHIGDNHTADDCNYIDLTPTPERITTKALELFYDHIKTRQDLIDYFCAELNVHFHDTELDRDETIRMIDVDLSDMLHNGNMDFYLTLQQMDSLTDDQQIALDDYLLDNYDAEQIADALIKRTNATD